MNSTLKIILISVLAVSVTSTAQAAKTTASAGASAIGKSVAGSGGGAYYPDDDFPSLPQAFTACGGIDNVATIWEKAWDGTHICQV